MKQAIKTTKMITIGLFTFCIIGLSQVVSATTKTEDPIELKFIGKIKNHPVFQLNLNKGEAYSISMKDENFDVLYSEKLKSKDVDFSRKYQLDIDEADLNALGFAVIVEVTSAKTHKTQVYKISSRKIVNENIVVAKL